MKDSFGGLRAVPIFFTQSLKTQRPQRTAAEDAEKSFQTERFVKKATKFAKEERELYKGSF
jgi:hypothetical protein